MALAALGTALIGLALWQFQLGRPWLLGLGLGLSAAAPLGFLLLATRLPHPRRHPVMVSVLTGFGCVMTMIGVQRFGEQHQWVAALALLMLAAWMAWQRWIWRRPDPPN